MATDEIATPSQPVLYRGCHCVQHSYETETVAGNFYENGNCTKVVMIIVDSGQVHVAEQSPLPSSEQRRSHGDYDNECPEQVWRAGMGLPKSDVESRLRKGMCSEGQHG